MTPEQYQAYLDAQTLAIREAQELAAEERRREEEQRKNEQKED